MPQHTTAEKTPNFPAASSQGTSILPPPTTESREQRAKLMRILDGRYRKKHKAYDQEAVTEYMIESYELKKDTRLYRTQEIQFAKSKKVAPPEDPVGQVKDVYGPRDPHNLTNDFYDPEKGFDLRRFRERYPYTEPYVLYPKYVSRMAEKGLWVTIGEPQKGYVKRDHVTISVTVEDVLNASGRIYPDARGAATKALYVTFKGKIPYKIENIEAPEDVSPQNRQWVLTQVFGLSSMHAWAMLRKGEAVYKNYVNSHFPKHHKIELP